MYKWILSRRSEYELYHVLTLSSRIEELIRVEYQRNYRYVAFLHALRSAVYKDSDSSL